MPVDWVAEVVVCRTRTRGSRCPATVLCYQAVVLVEAAASQGVERKAALAVVLRQPAQSHIEEEEEGCWSW